MAVCVSSEVSEYALRARVCARACMHQDDSEQTLYDGLVIVFGEPFCLRWLLPIPGGALVRKPQTVDVTPRVDKKPSEKSKTA